MINAAVEMLLDFAVFFRNWLAVPIQLNSILSAPTLFVIAFGWIIFLFLFIIKWLYNRDPGK